jgi:hypothetical protein
LGVQDKVENPQYKAWASFKPGSWVKHKTEMEGPGGQKVEMEMTATLVEVTPEKLVLDRKQTMTFGGRTMDLPVRKEEVEAKVDPAKTKIKQTEKEEEVTVAGKTLKCRVWESEMEQNGQKMTGTAWISPEIPGGMAQGEFSSPQAPKPMKMTAAAWEKK